MARLQMKRLTAVGNLLASSNPCQLWTVNVNTGAGSAILTIYDGTSASGTVIAVIDASTKSSQVFGIICTTGCYIVMSGGNADVTIGLG